MTRSWVRRWFPWIQVVWLVALSPALLFAADNQWWWLLGIPVLWLVSWWARGYPVTRTPLNWPISAIAILALLSLLITPVMSLSWPKASSLFLGLAVFFGAVDLCKTRHGGKLVVGGLILMGVGISLLGLLGTQWLDKSGVLAVITSRLPQLIRGLPGATEGFQPNEVAGALLWIVPLALMLVFETLSKRLNPKWQALLLGVAALEMSGVLLLTQSRSGWFGLAVSLAAMIAIVSRRARLILVALSFAVLIVVVVVGPDRIGSRIFSQPVQETIGTLNWSFRLEVWQTGLKGIADFPFTGMGIGTFRQIGRLLYPLSIPPTYDYAHAHNEFLQAALDLGIPGLIAFVALYLGAFWMLWELWRISSAAISQINLRYLTLGLTGSLFAHMIYGLTDAVALGAKPGILFWMLLGLITALFLQTRSATYARPLA